MKRVALLCLALALALTARPISAQQLEIRFLDVGQGDAALIRSGTKTLLIDAGGSPGVVSYLRAFHIDTIDLVIASHNHADHIGGMGGGLHSPDLPVFHRKGAPHNPPHHQTTTPTPPASGPPYTQPTTA